MTEYDKLVRDRIPEIIKKDNGTCDTKIVSGETYHRYLDRKLDEEIAEYRQSGEPEEIADIMEVLYALAKEAGISESELNDIRLKKREERGGFEKGIVLKRSLK